MIDETNIDKGSKFIAYEYMSIYVKQENEPLYSDCYANFGWQPIESREIAGIQQITPYYSSYTGNSLVNLKFKRDRKIKERSQLNLLQKKCESALTTIDSLEKSPESFSLAIALTFGITGLLFLVGAVLSFIANIIPLFIVTVIVGLAGCALALFNHKRLKNSKASQVAPKIEEQYAIIDKICEQAQNIWK